MKIRANEMGRAVDLKTETDRLDFAPGPARVRLLYASTKAALFAGGSFRKKKEVWLRHGRLIAISF